MAHSRTMGPPHSGLGALTHVNMLALRLGRPAAAAAAAAEAAAAAAATLLQEARLICARFHLEPAE